MVWDLDKLSRAVGLPRGVLGGRLNIDADVVATQKSRAVRVHIGLGNGSILSVGGIALGVDANLDGEHVEGSGSAVVEGIGSFATTWRGELAGHAADVASWRGITGESQIQATDVDLAPLRLLLPKRLASRSSPGKAFASLRIERLAPKDLPNVRVEVAGTRGLEIVRTAEKKSDPPLEVSGNRNRDDRRVNGESGDASGTTVLVDPNRRPLLTTTGSVRVDWHKLIAEPSDWLSQLSEAPVMLMVGFPDRSFDEMPPQIRPSALLGSVSARVLLSGTAVDPKLAATFDARQVTVKGSRHALPMDLHAAGQYELASGRFGGTAELSTTGHRVAHLTAQGIASIADESWSGQALLALEGVPLGVIPALADARVAGNLNGNIALQRPKPEVAPMLSANVNLADASIDLVRSQGQPARSLRRRAAQSPSRSGRRPGEADGGSPARARLVRGDPGHRSCPLGALDGRIQGLRRRRAITVPARHLLAPHGKVDATLAASLEVPKNAEGKPVGDWQAKVDGRAKVRDASLQITPSASSSTTCPSRRPPDSPVA